MAMARIIALAAAAACALALGGCAASASNTGPTGTWGQPGVQGQPSLELKGDKSVSGTDGCNGLSGTWRQTGEVVEFGQLASTLMACENVDTWLSGAKTASVSGQVMTVQDDSGKKIGTLERAK